MHNELITNIHHLHTFPSERIDFQDGIAADVPRMLAMIAIDTRTGDQQRLPFNTYIAKLGHEGGDRTAKSLYKHASDMPVFADAIDKDLEYNDGLWIGAKRLNAMELAGSVIVQKGVSLIDDNGVVVVNEGIIVEAVTKPKLKHELPAYYDAGIAVANSMAENGEVVFSVETAEDAEQQQSRIDRWINGRLSHDPEIHDSVFLNYAFKSRAVSLRRSDFGGNKTTPAVIFTDSKPTIDLTTTL